MRRLLTMLALGALCSCGGGTAERTVAGKWAGTWVSVRASQIAERGTAACTVTKAADGITRYLGTLHEPISGADTQFEMNSKTGSVSASVGLTGCNPRGSGLQSDGRLLLDFSRCGTGANVTRYQIIMTR